MSQRGGHACFFVALCSCSYFPLCLEKPSFFSSPGWHSSFLHSFSRPNLYSSPLGDVLNSKKCLGEVIIDHLLSLLFSTMPFFLSICSRKCCRFLRALFSLGFMLSFLFPIYIPPSPLVDDLGFNCGFFVYCFFCFCFSFVLFFWCFAMKDAITLIVLY